MATSSLVPVQEYLATTYRPDCDYVDGEVQERNLGELDHGTIQLTLGAFLLGNSTAWKIRVVSELRVQVSATRFRVPDLCVLRADAPKEQVVLSPPLLCIEILSPDDTVHRMLDRIHDYLDMGVSEVWLLNPKSRTAIVCTHSGMVEVKEGLLTLAGTPIEVSVTRTFSVLD